MSNSKDKVLNILESGFDNSGSIDYQAKKAEYRTVYKKKGPFQHLVDPAIGPEGGGGNSSGGTTYTAGEGIKIIGDIIKVDFTKVQEKLKAGNGIVIKGKTISVSQTVLDKIDELQEDNVAIHSKLVELQEEIEHIAPTGRVEKEDVDELFDDDEG